MPSKRASDLRNNFYFLPKVQERVAKDAREQVKKLAALVANRTEDLDLCRQVLARLKKTHNVLTTLAFRSGGLLQRQKQTMAVIQSILDRLNSELDSNRSVQYETELRVNI